MSKDIPVEKVRMVLVRFYKDAESVKQKAVTKRSRILAEHGMNCARAIAHRMNLDIDDEVFPK